jgi:hypothetical protein
MTRPTTDSPPWAMVDEGWGHLKVSPRAEISVVGYLARKPEGAEGA